ncbi:MAG: type II toxin-antitoxin system RelE/ParE family toxin [Candidatus Aenigmarchaeota archaeon]|nr:type II toxin-antitoxin system RelE/ParE family toxin [Candidatus Aenigmarchaeota archaeon]
MFEILLHPLADDFLKKIDRGITRQIKKKLIELKEFPEERGKHLKYTQFWSLRIGDYRAIYEIRKSEKKVIVLFIGHRDDVYDDFSKLY